MAYKIAEPVALESINRWQIESFNVELASLKFNYVIGMYLDEARVRTRAIEVPQAELLAVLQKPISGETMYAAIRRMLYTHARAKGYIPAGATDEAAPTPEQEEPNGN